MAGHLGAGDVALIGQVAARRRGVAAGGVEPATVRSVIDNAPADDDATPARRAAHLAERVLAARPPFPAPLETALLGLVCQLRLDGYELVSPQGVAAGMMRDLAGRPGALETVSRWVEDRSLKL